VRLRQRNTHEEDDGAHIEENKVQRRQSAHRKGREGAVEQPEHHHRGKSDQVDMGMQMRLLEALVDADPDAEGKAESPIEQPDQNEPAVDIVHEILSLSLAIETD
jgi:hypothetical protein